MCYYTVNEGGSAADIGEPACITSGLTIVLHSWPTADYQQLQFSTCEFSLTSRAHFATCSMLEMARNGCPQEQPSANDWMR